MYDRLNCVDCLNYEFDDPTLPNNCIHYRYCIKNVEKVNKEIEEQNKEMGNNNETRSI